jgi:hypothetical protein
MDDRQTLKRSKIKDLDVIRETGITNRPQACPYSLENILNSNFLPEN